MSYNRWTNRETWLINVWYNPESKEDIQWAKEAMEEQYDAIPDGPLKDMIDLGVINWEELENHFDEEEDQDDENEEDV